MTAREVILAQIQLFLPITGAVFAGTLLCARIFNVGHIYLSDVVLLAPFTFACVVALVVFYSRKTLTRIGMFVRYLIHLAFVLVSATALMLYAGWISFELSYLVITLPLQTTAHVAVGAFDELGSRRVAFQLNKALDNFRENHCAEDKKPRES